MGRWRPSRQPRRDALDGFFLFPPLQVNFRGSGNGKSCWAERTHMEKRLLALVVVLAVGVLACILALVLQYKASKSFLCN